MYHSPITQSACDILPWPLLSRWATGKMPNRRPVHSKTAATCRGPLWSAHRCRCHCFGGRGIVGMRDTSSVQRRTAAQVIVQTL